MGIWRSEDRDREENSRVHSAGTTFLRCGVALGRRDRILELAQSARPEGNVRGGVIRRRSHRVQRRWEQIPHRGVRSLSQADCLRQENRHPQGIRQMGSLTETIDLKRYGRLLAKAVPCVITTEAEHERALAIVDALVEN